jgi:hypothetical protein
LVFQNHFLPETAVATTHEILWRAYVSGTRLSEARKTMEDSHRHLAITAAEWQAFMDDVQATLDKFPVPAAEQAEVKALVESTRSSIVVAGAEPIEPSVTTGSTSTGPRGCCINGR